MGQIVLLDELTINQIAAGEVIERPQSVVKELMENSIDAGAKNITVEIKNGGISYIRITDDGKGIAVDDMEIAFERHATSKIRNASDLKDVKSMGFRGEALASIAAISKVSLKSKTANTDMGYETIVEGGNIISTQEASAQNGTVITVENLFYNTPVRYKFLKRDFTESGYIEDCITRIALIHPEIAIKYINSGKKIIQTTGNGSLKDTIYSIYGKDIAENILDVDYDYEGIHISGVIGKPEIARSNKSNQIFYVNKRNIKDKTLSAATEQAFKGLLTIGKFGFLILNIDIDPEKIDVNVHPTKSEIRFSDENQAFKALFHAIRDTLLKNDLIKNSEKPSDVDDNSINYLGDKKDDTSSDKIFDYSKYTKNINLNYDVNAILKRNKERLDKELREIENENGDVTIESIKKLEQIDQIEQSSGSKYTSTIEKVSPEERIALEETDEKANKVLDKIDEELKEFDDENNLDHVDYGNNIDDKNNENKEKIGDGEDKTEEYNEIVKSNENEFENKYENESENESEVNNKKAKRFGIFNNEKAEIKVSEDDVDFSNDYEDLDNDDLSSKEFEEEEERLKNEISEDDKIRQKLLDKLFGQQGEKPIENKKEAISAAEEYLRRKAEEKKLDEEVRENNIDDTREIDIASEISYETDDKKDIEKLENTEKTEKTEKTENDEKISDEETIRAEEVKEEKEKEEKAEAEAEAEEKDEDNEEVDEKFESIYASIFGKEAAKRIAKRFSKKNQEESPFSEVIYDEKTSLFKNVEPQYKFVGIVFKTYIIFEMGEEMYLMDQHAAHERIMYEKVKENYFRGNDEKDSQLMLLPDVIALSHRDYQIALDNLDIFKKAGFQIEDFGNNTIKISEVPTFCLDLNIKELFMETLDEINTVARTAKDEIENKFLATIACKAAVKANMALTEPEVNSLMQQLLKLPNPFTCPHGRPTVIKLSKTELERKFSRRQ